MNYRDILMNWRHISGRSRRRTDGVQGAISLACLRGWWRRGLAKGQDGRREEDHRPRPVTPWSHGLF
jgi:hypothetical protein